MGLEALAAIGVGTAVAGTVGSFVSGKKQAKAIENQANAQLQSSREQQQLARDLAEQQRADRDALVGRATEAAKPSVRELMQLDTLVRRNEDAVSSMLASIKSDEELLAAVNPALMEAGNQAYKLLKGEEAAVLGPLKNQRAQQRQQLENQLAQRLGSGWRTSSAGIEAMTKFDDATSITLASAQQQQLNSLLGLSASVRPNVTGKLQGIYQTALGVDQAVLGAEQNIQNRQVNALVGAYGAQPVNFGMVTNAGQQVTSNAGAPYAGDLASAQNMGNLFSGIGQLGGQAAGYGFFGSLVNSNRAASAPAASGYESFGSVLPQQFRVTDNPLSFQDLLMK